MIFKIVAFVLPLGLDTLAISIALGLRGLRPWRPALTFAVFEGLMPLFGILLARVVGMAFETAAVVIGGLILLGIGIRAIREGLRSEEDIANVSFGSLRSSVFAGIAISMDELAIGFPMGASGLPIAAVLTAVALQTLIVTAFGITIGARVGKDLGRSASRYAGIGAGSMFSLVGLWLIAERAFGK